jgi:DNA-binding transcriptional LysR family regulator
VQVQVHVSNRRVDLIEEGIDIALRVRARLEDDSSLVLRTLGTARKLLVASPDYLTRHGVPSHPHELTTHATLNASEEAHQQFWELQSEQGESVRVDLRRVRLMGFDFPLLLQVAEAGQGITLLPIMACADALHRGTLVPVLPQWNHPMGICHLLYPSRRGMLPAVRTLVEHLVDKLPGMIAGAQASCDKELANGDNAED